MTLEVRIDRPSKQGDPVYFHAGTRTFCLSLDAERGGWMLREETPGLSYAESIVQRWRNRNTNQYERVIGAAFSAVVGMTFNEMRP